ncbi:MAG: DUF4339 domain-containing protein [Ginsengibacter sp.]
MRQYYIYDGRRKKGPFDFEQLKLQPLTKETPVWYEGLKNWAMAGNMNELNDYFIPKKTPPPVPKTFEKKVPPHRDVILDSFEYAREGFTEHHEKSGGKRVIIFILAIVIIIGIVITFIVYR